MDFWEGLYQELNDLAENIPPDIFWGGMSILFAWALALLLAIVSPNQFGDVVDWVKLVGKEWRLSGVAIR